MNKIPSYFGTPNYVQNDIIHKHYLLTSVPRREPIVPDKVSTGRSQYYDSNSAISKWNNFEIDEY